MKTLRSSLVVISLLSLVSAALSQTVDTSTGTVLDSSSSATVVPPANPAPTRLVAKMLPAEADFKVRGEISFSVAGDVLSVSGRIEGMEPNSRYQLALPPSASTAKTETEVMPAEADRPGTPAAGRPDAGKPDGTSRPGAAGAGTQATSVSGTRSTSEPDPTEPAKASGALGILTSDAAGAANVNLTIHSLVLTTGPGTILGRHAMLTTIPIPGGGASPLLVASGVVEAPQPEPGK